MKHKKAKAGASIPPAQRKRMNMGGYMKVDKPKKLGAYGGGFMKKIMLVGLILMCASPMDLRTCDVMLRTENFFPTVEACLTQVGRDFEGMGLHNVYSRYKCFKMQERSF